ncbi:SDR family oxidoreductase [Millisia brevis]|uniref:SDR family oxidoreductase n=1 Tax=Millisia brevis TaxID=264148 RepID=UPI0008336A3B|nr:SDR family oxidoreductase [Millisia brevis]
MSTREPRVAVVTGASSGVGRATALLLAGKGIHVHALARRKDRLTMIADRAGGGIIPHAVDITDADAVARFGQAVGGVDFLVNNAGGARGSAPVVAASIDQWEWMWRTNVLGTVLVTRAIVPGMVERGTGTVVNVTSVAAFEPLDNSSGYSSSKHAESAVSVTLRNELLGTGVRVVEVCPGIIRSEFFRRRFPDDPERADRIYAGMTPLEPDDVADVISYAIHVPVHVNLDRIVVRPINQGSHGRSFRE